MYTCYYAIPGSEMANAIEAGLNAINRDPRLRDPREFRRGHGEPTYGVVVDGLAAKADLVKAEYEKMGQRVLVLDDKATPAQVATGVPLKPLFEERPAAAATPSTPAAEPTPVPAGETQISAKADGTKKDK